MWKLPATTFWKPCGALWANDVPLAAFEETVSRGPLVGNMTRQRAAR